MNAVKKYSISFLQSLLAGICIGVAATIFLNIENKNLGGTLFAIGLLMIFFFKFKLFTGRVGYLVENKIDYSIDLIFVFLGNFAGTFIMGSLIRLTRNVKVMETAKELVKIKLNDNLLSIFILSVFCGVMMYTAAEFYSKAKDPVIKYLGVFLPVMAFIFAGFEHVVANCYYFTLAGDWNAKVFLYILVMALGNSVGGVLFPLAKKLMKEEQK